MTGTIDAIIILADILRTRPGLEEVGADAVRIYGHARETGQTKGKHREALAVALISLACRRRGQQVPFRELLQIATNHDLQVTQKEVGRYIRRLSKQMKCNVGIVTLDEMKKTTLDNMVLPEDLQEKIEELYPVVSQALPNRDPSCILATLLYISAKQLRYAVTQPQIGSLFGVSDMSLRWIARELEPLGIVPNTKSPGERGPLEFRYMEG
jgi:transcription initiation factor TFIIIB Brf1 subunit/transcription initiation factor TFIIB